MGRCHLHLQFVFLQKKILFWYFHFWELWPLCGRSGKTAPIILSWDWTIPFFNVKILVAHAYFFKQYELYKLFENYGPFVGRLGKQHTKSCLGINPPPFLISKFWLDLPIVLNNTNTTPAHCLSPPTLFLNNMNTTPVHCERYCTRSPLLLHPSGQSL